MYFNRIEGWIETSFNFYYVLVIFFILIQVLLVAFVQQHLVAVVYWTYWPLFLLIGLFPMMASAASILLMVAMKQHQHFEFANHKVRIFFRSFASIATITFMVFLLMAMCVFLGLVKSQQRFGFESDFKDYAQNFKGIKQYFYWVISLQELFLMYPFVLYFSYLTFFTPHDCYSCFNRLPNKRYSIYQFTQEERQRFRENTFGKGAIKRFEEMVQNANRKPKKVVESRLTLVKGSGDVTD